MLWCGKKLWINVHDRHRVSHRRESLLHVSRRRSRRYVSHHHANLRRNHRCRHESCLRCVSLRRNLRYVWCCCCESLR